MLLNELTPAQVSMLLEVECTAAEKAELRAAVSQFNDSALGCLKRCTGQGLVEGLLLASELQKVRARFAGRINQIVGPARRRYLERTVHRGQEPDRADRADG
ncbi:hypothetical protein [Streptantibioticus ferralitis]|uniref:Uncharacterized protein n=1 Tax=Streptantibioticus ferralitis TaxID=236510 RepID=A0ABT5YW57_9ACTN|nr:hypothetical protein [Streptantibioticus ferralitis]MDF2255647.1 hypothetical protein [Streptantibioticus ferralitis]